MPATLLIRSLSFDGFGFECAAIGFDVSRTLAIVADSVILELAPDSLICQWSGRTSSPIVRSVSQTLYYISYVCRVFCKRLSELLTSEYLTTVVEALHNVVIKVSHEERRLLMSSIALSSSSNVFP